MMLSDLLGLNPDKRTYFHNSLWMNESHSPTFIILRVVPSLILMLHFQLYFCKFQSLFWYMSHPFAVIYKFLTFIWGKCQFWTLICKYLTFDRGKCQFWAIFSSFFRTFPLQKYFPLMSDIFQLAFTPKSIAAQDSYL